jgi:hypothetical protein
VKLLKVKTARLADVVAACGTPEVYTLWQKPATDRSLQSLMKNNRIMIVQKTDRGSDFGVVGFKERQGAIFLVFPKSLRRFTENRIVGIHWTLVKSR